MGVFTPLFLIEADHVTAVFYPDFLKFEWRRILGVSPLRHALKPPPPVTEHFGTHFLLSPHAHPHDVTPRRLVVFEARQGGLADHAPVSHHRDFPKPEAPPHPLNYGHQ